MKTNYLFLAAYMILCCIHLYHSWMDDRANRAKTKPFLLLFLLLYYLASVAADVNGSINIPLVLALLTSWLGDVLLIPHGHKWFVIGGISFMFCHFFFMCVYYEQISFHAVPWLVLLPAAVLYFGIVLRIIMAVRDNTPRKMIPPMYFYLLMNSMMNLFALMQLFSRPSAAAVTALAGAVLFYISDCCLFLVRYHRRQDLIFKKHFTVMATYLLGEFLITQGMLMI